MRIFKHNRRHQRHGHRRERLGNSGIAFDCRNELSIIADHRQGTSDIATSYEQGRARTYSL